jgi:hypothetical protein
VTTSSNWNEASMVEAINHHFADADKAIGEVKYSRIKAGELLIEASKHVPAGEWGRWCKANVKRSERDIRKVMKVAGADDPEAALREERKRNADGRIKRTEEPPAVPSGHRDRKVNSADQSAPPPPQDTEVASLRAEAAKWKEECARLADNFMERTKEWMTLKKEKEAWERSMAELRGELFMARRSGGHGSATFTKEEWMVLIKCLHPDGSPSQELKTHATQLLNVRKASLVGQGSPSHQPSDDGLDLEREYAEWCKAHSVPRDKYSAEAWATGSSYEEIKRQDTDTGGRRRTSRKAA